jgi:citrate lyase subunit beta/citryl-CoA lyase
LTADLQCKRTKEGKEIFYARTRLVMAARAAGVEVYDTPFTDVHDDEGIQVDAAFAKSLGFSGKASISPRHVEVINTVFTPTMEEIDYAYEVIDAIELAKQQGKGAISLRGKMIDAPIVARAERTIAVAEALGIRREEV